MMLLEEKISGLWSCVRSDSPQRHIRAAEIASDIYSLCIEQITEAELAYCSSVLLNEEEGIVKFLRETATLDEFVNCKDELLHVLTEYVRNVGIKVIQYAVSIKDVCVSLFSRDKTAKVKNATFPLLVCVLELCGKSNIADSLNVPKIAKKYFQAALQPTKHTSTVRCGIYHLLGVLCQHFPEHMIEYSERLIGIYTRTLKAEMVSKKGKKVELPIIAGCLKGLTAYLNNFTQSASEGSVYAQDIYNYTRKAVDPEASLTRYDVPRAGLSLLAEHAAQFKEYLAKDTEQMYTSLYKWSSHNNRECKFVGLKAMESFFKQVSNQIAEFGDRKSNLKIYQEFMKRFRKIIDDPNTHTKELAVAIKGFGFFAKPCKVYGTTEDLHCMFDEMMQRSEHLFASTPEAAFVEEVISHLPTFMQALSSISRELEGLPEGYILSLERQVVLLFEYYPRLPNHMFLQSGIALLKLLLSVATKPIEFQYFLPHIVFQGLVRSCSHPVVIEAGDGGAVVSMQSTNQSDQTGTEYKVASYKDYINIWSQLMDPGILKSIDGDFSTHELRPRVHSMCYGEFVQAVLVIIKKLNLSCSSIPATEDKATPTDVTPTDTSPPNEEVSSDPISGLHPSVPRDFQIFINLVELCRNLLPSVTPHLFSQWVFIFSKETIAMATHYPLVSGFYKLLACVLNICKKNKYFEGVSPLKSTLGDESQSIAMETSTDTEEALCYLLYRKFIREVIVRMQQYKDDLLSACLQLVLSIPTEMVQSEFNNLLPCVEVSLKLGIGYLPLAVTVITALESWMHQIPTDKLHSVVVRLLPLLDDYLQISSKTGKDKDLSDVTAVLSTNSRSSRGRKLPLKVLKQWKEGIQGSKNDLSLIRERILYLLGSLGGVVNVALLEQASSSIMLSQVVSWDSSKKLEFPVPFSDLKPSIYIDPFLPRVCDLAVSSSDRQTKIAACEFLHAVVLFIIGKSAQQTLHKKSPMTKIFKKVFPFLLQLGCDVERVAEQLFRPLIFQMIHWFTRNTQYESPDTIALLDAILEGIEHPTNASLRDFSSQCVREFLLWSIKQTSKKQQERSPMNTKSLLKRIYSMASHPSATKRLGSALALNSMYPVFREEELLVDMFVIEILVVMINSLKMAHRDESSLGTVDQCKLAIGHIAKIVRAKCPILCSQSKNRRVPRGLKSADLIQLVGWLLSQSGCPETETRLQCIQLFTVLAPMAAKVLNTKIWVRRTIETEGGYYFVSRFERAGSNHSGGIAKTPILADNSSLVETLKWLDNIQAALDCYIWVLKDQLVSPSEMFNETVINLTDRMSNLFTSIECFLSKHVYGSFESKMAASESLLISPLEEEQYGGSRSNVVVKILTLSEILLVKHTSECSLSIITTLWCDSLWSVLFSVLFDSESIGVQHGDYTTIDTLSEQVVKLLKAMMEYLPENIKTDVIVFFSKKLSEKQYDLSERLPLKLSEKTFVKEHLSVDVLLQGYLRLADSNLLRTVYSHLSVDVVQIRSQLMEEVIEMTLSSLTAATDIDAPVRTYTTKLVLKLALYLCGNVKSIIEVLLHLKKGSANGLVLYWKYSDVINGELVQQLQLVIDTLLDYRMSHPNHGPAIFNGLINYLVKDRSLRKQKLPLFFETIIDNSRKLCNWWETESSTNTDSKLAIVTLLQKILSAQPKAMKSLEDEGRLTGIVYMYCELVHNPKNSLTFKSKILEILSSFLNVSERIDRLLRESLNNLVVHQFPLKSSELPIGSVMYNEYITVLDKLLESLVSSGSLILLKLFINITCREAEHIHEERILSSMATFINSVSDSTAGEVLNVCFEMFINEKDYPTSSRRRIGEGVCCTLLKECSRAALIQFFVSHIDAIMKIVEGKITRNSDPKLEDQLVTKLCCFQFLEILYNRLTSSLLSSIDSKINNGYCEGKPTTGKELTQSITKNGHVAKSEDLHGDRTHYELRRQYHCHAYNMLVAVISCTQTKPQFYQGFLFKEDLTKGQYLFDNLIDAEKEYRFEVELEAPIKRRKQLLTIRDELQHLRGTTPDSSPSDHTPLGSSPPFNVHYISSVYLAQSSLSSDVSQYDFTYATTHSTGSDDIPATGTDDVKSSSYIVSEEQLEEDSLNSHECMITVMKLLNHMQHNKITPVIDKGQRSPEMPPWMSLLHKKLSEGTTEKNVRLFIARVIVNRPKIFEPFAKHWLPTLTQLVISGNSGGTGLHYFSVDIIATMLSWNAVAILEDRYLASRLMEFVMEHCNHDNRSVFRNNLEIARTTVECWKDYIQIPTKLLFTCFSNTDRSSRNNRVGIQLLGIIVANNLPPFDASTAGAVTEHNYYNAFAGNMNNKYKEVYGATGEVLGMLLLYMQESNHSFSDSLQDIVIKQLLILTRPSEQNEDRFIMCLHKIQLHYPKIVQRFVDKLLFMLPMLQGVFRSHCLEILQSQADIQPKFYLRLENAGFHGMLSHRDEATQIASLKIVQGMLNELDIKDIAQLLPYLTAFSSHSSVQCRITMYNVLMAIYNRLSLPDGDTDILSNSSTTKSVLSTARDQLLAGLSDDAEEIRLKMYEFWNKNENLMPETLGRLSQLLGTLYSTKTEQHFLYHATNLLLELTSRSPDFNRSIFDTPLSECKFEDYRSIDLSWHQRHLQMTPLFAATQASQSGSQSDSGSLGMGAGMLRATQQSLAFTPTQEAGSYTWMAPAAQSLDSASFTMGSTSQTPDSKQSALLFRKPTMRMSLKNPLRVSSDALAKTTTNQGVSAEEERRREVLKLKKRFLKDKEASSSYFANTEIRKKIMREEHKRHQKAARQSHVVMYRKYRDGELPDIQIKHSEIIRPLQALAQYDNGLARLLFASLFNALFAEVDHHLTKEEAETTKKAVREGINTILESSQQFFPPFIGSLQDICYHESQLCLSPSNITTSSLISKQELIGIMLLEKQLMDVIDSTTAKSAKRSKGTQAVSVATETWVEASRLYKSLGDYDTVHGVFGNLDGIQDITKSALEAEERGDYQEALGLYKKALGTPGEDWTTGPTQVEEDLWEDSLLNCYSHLTKWHDLDTAATNNIENPWATEVWEDTYYQEHYLPFIIQSKLKLWCLEGTDKGLNSFLEKSLQNESSRLMLESRYPEPVTMAFIVKGDMDRAQYYLSLSLRAFQQDWSANGSDHLSNNTCGKMQCLQRLTEIKEFLSIMRQSDNSSNHENITRLVYKWKNRYPDDKMDSIPVWDDIITNRQVMLKKMGEKIRGLTVKEERDAMDAEDSGVSDLKRILSLEYTEMCMKIAKAACIQYNFPVSKKYLHIVEKSIQTEFSDNQLIQLQWLHGIANMRLRQMAQDPSPSRCDTIISLAHKLVEFQSVPFLSKNISMASRHQSIKAKTFDLLAEIFSAEEDGAAALSILSSDVSNQLCQLCGYDTTTDLDPPKVAEKLWCQVISSYNTSIKCGTERNVMTGKMEPNVTSLEEMASFCDKILRKQYDEDIETGLDTTQFPSVVIAHTLKAMSLGSKQAVEQFPRLLQLVQDFPETAEQFLKKSSSVPCWMFISWISQMVALIDKEAGYIVADILLKLADTYPQALCYPFKVSSCGFKFDDTREGNNNRSNFEKLKDKLDNHLVDDFIDALELLNSPELVCKDMLDEIKPLLQQTKRDTSAIKDVWRSLNEQLLEDRSNESPSSLYGTPSVQKGRKMKDFYKAYHKKIIDTFGKDGSKIHTMQGTQFTKLVSSLYDNMKKTQEGHGLLKEYSPWLDSFQSMDYSQTIEVPGQYDGKSKPLPEYHAKIAGFDSKILVLGSVRKPKRLTIIGDNTKECMFLVKGGEDLRQDQRIEQLFEVMNGILSEDAACSQRQLKIRTYEVIPMTTRVGLIEWVKNTKPLKDFLMDELLTDSEKKKPGNAINAHYQWTKKFGGYSEMYKKAHKCEVEKMYLGKVHSIPRDLLRRGFLSFSATPEAFVLLRSHFIKTFATANICQYVLGIGDRHLSNFMVDMENGGLVPIDFGHAFHTATQFLPYPELMPMRLTPQFVNLCLPHKHSGQLRSCMVHTLRALQSSPSTLLNTMDVFIKEPSVDWKNYARKQAAALKVGGGENESLWYPREKIRACKKKLQGYNSSHLMLVDLKYGHGKKPEFSSLKNILMGDTRTNLRARVKEKCQNVEEQIDCLIDHATDPNILGRTYHGWEPWV